MVVMSWKLLDSQTVFLDSWVALLDLNVHLVRRLADVGSVPASSNALREGYLCVWGNMCGIIMQHLAPSLWTPCPQEQRQGDSPKKASLCAREIWRLTDGDWWHLATIDFFWVVVAFGGVVDCAVWFLRFSTESLGFVPILDIWWSGWHGQASFHSSSNKAVLLAEASCYLPALLKFNTWAILSLLISSDQSRFTILGLIE
jgi:hypothetical protein